MPTSAPGSGEGLPAAALRPGGSPAARRGRRGAGFTLIELLVVVAIIAIASAMVSVSMRDPAAAKLEQEAARLASLLESARAEARSSGIAARWEPLLEPTEAKAFRFVGLSTTTPMPTHWLDAATTAQVLGARSLVLGPEPVIGEQRLVLRLADQRLMLVTDGIGPFAVSEGLAPAP
ncbi:MAG: prepilin-type N-terminal cleavage/methylation domain-containing protein [Pseudomonadota bacterium]|nr:prepilin-type N-terminal cleavage/methylation domain-containing protein [Pseudomonadota bacterium]